MLCRQLCGINHKDSGRKQLLRNNSAASSFESPAPGLCLMDVSFHWNLQVYWERGAQDGHLDFHTAPELCLVERTAPALTSAVDIANVRVCHAVYVIVLVWTEMLVCRYFVCWVEFDELYLFAVVVVVFVLFLLLLLLLLLGFCCCCCCCCCFTCWKNTWPVNACVDECDWYRLTVSDACVLSRLKDKVLVFYDIYVLMFFYYTVCYFTGIFYAVVRKISMSFIDN